MTRPFALETLCDIFQVTLVTLNYFWGVLANHAVGLRKITKILPRYELVSWVIAVPGTHRIQPYPQGGGHELEMAYEYKRLP